MYDRRFTGGCLGDKNFPKESSSASHAVRLHVSIQLVLDITGNMLCMLVSELVQCFVAWTIS